MVTFPFSLICSLLLINMLTVPSPFSFICSLLLKDLSFIYIQTVCCLAPTRISMVFSTVLLDIFCDRDRLQIGSNKAPTRFMVPNNALFEPICNLKRLRELAIILNSSLMKLPYYYCIILGGQPNVAMMQGIFQMLY